LDKIVNNDFQNAVEIAQTVVWISLLTVFKMQPSAILVFKSLNLGQPSMSGHVQNFVKIAQTVAEILRFFDFQDGGLSPL